MDVDKYIDSAVEFCKKDPGNHCATMVIRYHMERIEEMKSKLQMPKGGGETIYEQAYIAGFIKCLSEILKLI
jgi:hypothetical protein